MKKLNVKAMEEECFERVQEDLEKRLETMIKSPVYRALGEKTVHIKEILNEN